MEVVLLINEYLMHRFSSEQMTGYVQIVNWAKRSHLRPLQPSLFPTHLYSVLRTRYIWPVHHDLTSIWTFVIQQRISSKLFSKEKMIDIALIKAETRSAADSWSKYQERVGAELLVFIPLTGVPYFCITNSRLQYNLTDKNDGISVETLATSSSSSFGRRGS